MTWLRRRHDAVGRGNGPVDDPGGAVAAPRARRRARAGGAAAVALALAAGCTPLLDTGFGDGTGAVVIDDPDEVSADEPADVIVQPDGKIVVLFSTRVVAQYLTLVRLDADGSLDTTFGDGGRLDTGLNGGARGADLEVQPDGRYLVSSYLHSGWAAGVTR